LDGSLRQLSIRINHRPRDNDPRRQSISAHMAGGKEMLLLTTVRPLPLPFFRPAPGRAPPRFFCSFMVVIGAGIEPAPGGG